MTTRDAACQCGQLRLRVTGDPEWVSMCHCTACQRRTGSAFGLQAGFQRDQGEIEGRYQTYGRIPDDGQGEHVFHFCPECGSTVFHTEAGHPERLVVAVGSFADPSFPPPQETSYDARRHPWLALPDSIKRDGRDAWRAAAGDLYQEQRYAEAAAAGRELLEADPDEPVLHYNVACCESLCGHEAEAVEHLRRAIEAWDGFREMARGDSDFDPVRDRPAFVQLVADPA
jgi:hypothetical protein